jgi:hypothetical protein
VRTLAPSEKRTIRIAAAVLGAYFLFFCTQKLWKVVGNQRAQYVGLLHEVEHMRAQLRPYEGRVAVTKKLMEELQLDPARLSRTSVVAEASSAIQKAALSGGLQMGPIHESPPRLSTPELASIQLDCLGPLPALLSFMYRFERLGYPLLIDSVQLSSDPTKPGMSKLHLAIIILDFEQWKGEAVPNA